MAQRNISRELYHPKYKTIKRALKNPLHTKSIKIYYTDSVFPNDTLLRLKNVENIQILAPIPWGAIKYAKHNRSNITDSIFAFPRIRIDTIALKQLSHLKYLTIVGFDFPDFPSGICVMKGLVGLAINIGSIRTIPKEIACLKDLVILDLRLNNINSLPKEISLLSNLRYLYLINNSFTHIPPEFLLIKNLKEVSLNNVEQRFDNQAELSWPYVFHLNKIDYIREIGLFTDILKRENISRVLIHPQPIKKELISKSIDKKLLRKINKIKWFG